MERGRTAGLAMLGLAGLVATGSAGPPAASEPEGWLRDRSRHQAVEGVAPPTATAGQPRQVGGLEFAWIPPGKILMGDMRLANRAELNAHQERVRRWTWEPEFPVEFRDGFWMAVTKVTVDAYLKVMEGLPAAYPSSGIGRSPPDGRSPVITDWYQAMEFCRRVTEVARRNGEIGEGWVVTLPSEAQWEYAARAGGPGVLPRERMFALAGVKAWNPRRGDPRPVGQGAPNDFGLFDVVGNANEWMADNFRPGDAPPHQGGRAWLEPGSRWRTMKGGYEGSEQSTGAELDRYDAHPAKRSKSLDHLVIGTGLRPALVPVDWAVPFPDGVDPPARLPPPTR